MSGALARRTAGADDGPVRPRVRHLSFVLAACAMLLSGPPARAQLPATASIVASDFAFTAAGGGPPQVTIAFGGEVEFSYPSGASMHNVAFTGPQPSLCMSAVPSRQVQGIRAPVPDHPYGPGWRGRCTFTAAGAYPFVCGLHPSMTGVVTAVDTGGPKPVPPNPIPSLDFPAGSSPRVAVAQRGLVVRGSVIAAYEGSTMLVGAYARHRALYASASAREVRVGRTVLSPVHGRTAFSVSLSAVARKVLRRDGRLPISVRITVTPPPARGGPYTVRRSVVMRFGSRRAPDDPLANGTSRGEDAAG